MKYYDIIVAGGGPAGCAAAIAAARRGADTLLIERYGFLGGMSTAGLVVPFMPYGTRRTVPPFLEYKPGIELIGGIFKEVTESLIAEGAFKGTGYPLSFEPEVLKLILDDMVIKSGAHLLLHTFVIDAACKNNEISELVAVSKSGIHKLKASVYIDCTGDGDVAARSGAKYEQGRSEDGACQPATLMFIMGGARLTTGYMEYSVPDGYKLPQGRVLLFKMPREGEVVINMTRVTNFDGTNVEELSRGEIEARGQIKDIVEFMRNNVEGFEHSYFVRSAAQIGVRETRRIMGQYVLTAADIMGCAKFEDAVAKSAYPIDIHNPSGKGCITKNIPEGEWYEIPYRCLLPVDIRNLMVAGRCASATHEAQAALRVQPTCYAMGEGAGTGAANAVEKGITPG